jgi:hypothetical protein
MRGDLDNAFLNTGAKIAFIITDYFKAAGSNAETEMNQGRIMIDACKAAGCEFVVYSSCADIENFNENVHHVKSKLPIENYLKGIPKPPSL